MKHLFWLALNLFCSASLLAQNNRVSEHNSIGWYNYFGNFKISSRFGIHTEYQWRRTNTLADRQQSLLRLGVNYRLSDKVQFRAGYGWIETFAYGDTPINALGKPFTEHRLFQMATLADKSGRVEFSHRFMLEQRWIGTYSRGDLSREDGSLFANRLRYMFRLQLPLKGAVIADNMPYLALYDEVFIGFGANVNENIFDQNRLGVLLGYRFKPSFSLEAGYLNQMLYLGREVNNRNVVQYNNGIIVNALFTVSLAKRPAE